MELDESPESAGVGVAPHQEGVEGRAPRHARESITAGVAGARTWPFEQTTMAVVESSMGTASPNLRRGP